MQGRPSGSVLFGGSFAFNLFGGFLFKGKPKESHHVLGGPRKQQPHPNGGGVAGFIEHSVGSPSG